MPTPVRRPRLIVVSPFIDKRHGTERCVAEQIERLADVYEIHLYSSRVEDVDLSRITWHHVPEFPGPHLIGYIWWFFANQFIRWRDRKFNHIEPDVTFSPGINCFDADIVSVHVVFGRLRQNLRNELRLSRNAIGQWPVILHRRIYYALISRLERVIYGREKGILAPVSRKTAEDISELYGRTKNVVVIHNGVDTIRFSPGARLQLRDGARGALNLEADECGVLLIGNGWKNKGLPCLIEATALIKDRRIRLLIVGNDSAAPYEEAIQRHGLSEAVNFLPPRADVEFYYAAADVYASPSIEDAFPLPPLEAMACGLPVITSNSAGGPSEFIRQGEDGLVLENPTDAKTLSEWLARLAGDADWRIEMGSAAAQTASRYTWAENSAALERTINSLLKMNTCGRSDE
jgi:glycosyltransferase involved in cell wall biosynthesis